MSYHGIKISIPLLAAGTKLIIFTEEYITAILSIRSIHMMADLDRFVLEFSQSRSQKLCVIIFSS